MSLAHRADARANRQKLIDAAHDIFREKGVEAEMKEIAERAGVGVGTIYRNFPTKSSLIEAIVGRVIADIYAAVEGAAVVDDPAEAVRTLLREGFAISERSGDLMLMLMHSEHSAGLHSQFKSTAIVERFTVIVRRGIASCGFRADIDPEIAAALLQSALIPWQYQYLRTTRTHEQLIEGYMQVFLYGAAAASARS